MEENKTDLALLLERRTRELRASEERLRNLIAKNADGIVIVDGEGMVRFVNPAAEALFNRPAARLVGSPFGFPTVAGETTEIDVLRPGGELVVAEVRVVETEWEGEPAYLGSLRDVTERKRAEEGRAQLIREQAARAQAEQASHLKDEFLATVSHELRTPLNVMLGWARMLRSGTLDTEAEARALETIERNAHLQAQIVDDLLDVSRIMTAQVRLDIRPLELASLVQKAAESMRLAARAKGVHLHLTLDAVPGPVLGDPGRLQQVIWNLLSNAIKFNEPGGEVEVRLEVADRAAVISVKDTGAGISPDFMPHVFDRFRQADGSTTRRHGGLGLGLAIVRHLVELHGGSIHVESQGAGQGATFRVRLPLAVLRESDDLAADLAGQRSAGSVSAESLAELTGTRVLLVDDEPDTRELVSVILGQRGAEVKAVGTAEEALQQLVDQRYDILVADIGMSGSDGYMLIRQVRSLEEREGAAKIPAIALTAYARGEDRSRALAAGYHMHVPKPVEPADLIIVVARMARAMKA